MNRWTNASSFVDALFWNHRDAKRPKTRARRIEKYVTMLNEHKKIY